MNMKQIDQFLADGTLTCNEVARFFNNYADITFIPTENEEKLQAFYCRD
ncbi:hypothetical protein [Ferdinandcohnia sp. Marseille-Q9671]